MHRAAVAASPPREIGLPRSRPTDRHRARGEHINDDDPVRDCRAQPEGHMSVGDRLDHDPRAPHLKRDIGNEGHEAYECDE